MAKQAKRSKPEQLALPGFDPVQPKPWSMAGCIDLNWRQNLREYNSWKQMIYRCENPKNNGFERYGAKGVKVCPEWRRSFAAFVRDMGRRPDGMTLDRIDASGDYEPANCRWLDAGENTRRAASKAIGRFPSQVAASLSRGMSRTAVVSRLRRGWCEEHAAILPKGAKRPADCEACQTAQNDGRRSWRLRRGWCEEHAATLPKGSKRPADCEACASKAVR